MRLLEASRRNVFNTCIIYTVIKEKASQRGLFNPGGESSSDDKSLERSEGRG